jgi:hypothetical protein
MVPIIEVDGGVPTVSAGHAIVVDWDNIRESLEAAEYTLYQLRERSRSPVAKTISLYILALWPELRGES